MERVNIGSLGEQGLKRKEYWMTAEFSAPRQVFPIARSPGDTSRRSGKLAEAVHGGMKGGEAVYRQEHRWRMKGGEEESRTRKQKRFLTREKASGRKGGDLRKEEILRIELEK